MSESDHRTILLNLGVMFDRMTCYYLSLNSKLDLGEDLKFPASLDGISLGGFPFCLIGGISSYFGYISFGFLLRPLWFFYLR